MSKTNSVLSISTYEEGMRRGNAGFEIQQGLTAMRYENGDIYFDREELAMIERLLRQKIEQEPAYPDRIAAKIAALALETQDYRFPMERYATLSLQEISLSLQQEFELSFALTAFMSYRGSVQMSAVLGERVRSIVTAQLTERGERSREAAILHALQEPGMQSVVWKEKRDLLRIAAKGLTDIDLEKAVAGHIVAHGWLAYHWFQGEPWTQEIILQRISRLGTQKECIALLHRLDDDQKESEESVRRIFSDLSFSSEEVSLVRQYRQWISLRTHVKDNINLAAFKLLPLLELLARRIGWPAEEMPLLTFHELSTLAIQDLANLHRLASERRVSFGCTLAGSSSEIYTPARPLPRKRAVSGTELKGQIAFAGLVRGIARILRSPKEASRVATGDILVVPMTTPDFLPAMERAAAFVTDEGGITCHAAIVAREMRKPCIVGTARATTTFKDGDMLEIDALKGIVRKIV
jgi:phosphohistidine swiveling domain-containing protein